MEYNKKTIQVKARGRGNTVTFCAKKRTKTASITTPVFEALVRREVLVILKFTIAVCASILAYSISYLAISKYRRKRLVQRMFPNIENESALTKVESEISFMGYVYLIINIPGVVFCNTIYRMDKAGVSGYVVTLASTFVYAAIIPLIYFLALARVSH